MGKSQRTKGAVYEREVAKVFSLAFGQDFERNIGQARDGGNDIDVGPLVTECKRRKRLDTLMGWYAQAAEAAQDKQTLLSASHEKIPLVVMRADNAPSMAFLSLDHFVSLVYPELRRRLAL